MTQKKISAGAGEFFGSLLWCLGRVNLFSSQANVVRELGDEF